MDYFVHRATFQSLYSYLIFYGGWSWIKPHVTNGEGVQSTLKARYSFQVYNDYVHPKFQYMTIVHRNTIFNHFAKLIYRDFRILGWEALCQIDQRRLQDLSLHLSRMSSKCNHAICHFLSCPVLLVYFLFIVAFHKLIAVHQSSHTVINDS